MLTGRQIAMSVCNIIMRRKVYILRLVIITFTWFICVTVVTKSLQFALLAKRYRLPLIYNEITSNTYQVLEPSYMESFSPKAIVNNDIPTDISNFLEPMYPIMLWNKYLINNPDLCNLAANISILIVVKTDPLNFDRRQIIRSTWGNYRYFQYLGVIRVLFLMGKVQKKEIQQKISGEFDEHLDILQGDFLDTYRNLTNKGIMGLRWISENCIQAKMVVNVDDDIMLDMYNLLQIVYPKYKTKTRYIICNIFMDGKGPVVRDKRSKWYVKDSELKHIGLLDKMIYPPYCSGFTVLLATDLIPVMLGIAHETPFFWVDDVYMYGLLPLKAGRIKYYSLSSNYTFSYKDAMNCFRGRSTCNIMSVAETKTHEMCPIWIMIQSYYLKREILQKV